MFEKKLFVGNIFYKYKIWGQKSTISRKFREKFEILSIYALNAFCQKFAAVYQTISTFQPIAFYRQPRRFLHS